jgi:uncharacterized protein (TIGR02757 family)
MGPINTLKQALDALYDDYDFIGRAGRDPISLPARYRDRKDIEVAAFIASALAYGRVDLFLPVARAVLERMGEHPAEFAAQMGPGRHSRLFEGLSYRFQREGDLAALVYSIGRVINSHGGLEAAFMKGFSPEHEDIGPALTHFMHELVGVDTSPVCGPGEKPRGLLQLFPSPENGGAAKRGCLFLRWMVRDADIDFGLWKGVPRDRLVIPLDTHIARVGRCLGLTKKRSNGWRTAQDITRALKELEPGDPLKYDFALCHRGIQGICGKDSCRACSLRRFSPSCATPLP